MLEKMLQMQRELQEKHYGAAPDTLEGAERIQFVKDMHIAITDELHEALAEVSWKPWAKAEYFNEAAFKGELVDAFHFFMNLMMVGNITAEDLYEGYVKKNALNAKRQIEGYDGVSSKCTGCGRALDDEAVLCTSAKCSISVDQYLINRGEYTAMTQEEKARVFGEMYGRPAEDSVEKYNPPLLGNEQVLSRHRSGEALNKPMGARSGRYPHLAPLITVKIDEVSAIPPEVIARTQQQINRAAKRQLGFQ